MFIINIIESFLRDACEDTLKYTNRDKIQKYYSVFFCCSLYNPSMVGRTLSGDFRSTLSTRERTQGDSFFFYRAKVPPSMLLGSERSSCSDLILRPATTASMVS